MGQSSSAPKISSQDRAILGLKTQRDSLRQYQRRIRPLLAQETLIARTCLANGNKSGALLALRKKKYQESLLSKTDAQLAQLEKLVMDVEFALVQKDVLFGLEQGTKVLEQINKEMGGVEKVDMLMERSSEAREYQREIGELLSGVMSRNEEEEVEEELDRLEREENEKVNVGIDNGIEKVNMPGLEGVVEPMPQIPSSNVVVETGRDKQKQTERIDKEMVPS